MEQGAAVARGETDKAEVELEASARGRLRIMVTASDAEVAVGTTIGSIEEAP